MDDIMYYGGYLFIPFGIISIILGIGCFISLGITKRIGQDSVGISAMIGGILGIFYMLHEVYTNNVIISIVFTIMLILVIVGITLGIWSIRERIKTRQIILSWVIAVGIVWFIILLIYGNRIFNIM